MPRKRNNCAFRNKKQKQMITARLIEISMKVDDYVYYHKPISESAAEDYMREVTSYKTQCAQDERSLQVIEKLSRCMKGIIKEHQECRGDVDISDEGSIPMQDTRADSVSPVYSLLEEDRELLTQITEKNTEFAVDIPTRQDIEDVEVVDLCSDDDDVVPSKITKNATLNKSNCNTDVEVDIQRGISNLSITQTESLTQESTDAFYSQSILNNYEDINNLQKYKTNTAIEKISTNSSGINNDDVTKTLVNIPLINKNNESTFINTQNQNVATDGKNKVMSIFPKTGSSNIETNYTETSDNQSQLRSGSVSSYYSINNRMTGIQEGIPNTTNLGTLNSCNRTPINPFHNDMFPGKLHNTISKTSANITVNNNNSQITNPYKAQNVQTKGGTLTTNKKNTSKSHNKQKVKDMEVSQTTVFTLSRNDTYTKSYISTGIDQNQTPAEFDTLCTFNNRNTETQERIQINLQNRDIINHIPVHPNQNSVSQTKSLNINKKTVEITATQNNHIKHSNEVQNTHTAKHKTFETQTNRLTINASTNNENVIKKNTEIKKRAPRKKRNTEEKDIKPTNKTKQTKPKQRKNKKLIGLTEKDTNVPIYNTNVVNDLSWMENIRYVREVGRDEIDTKLNFDEYFWDNYNLPENWNESEFVY